MPLLYNELSAWYRLLTPVEEYVSELSAGCIGALDDSPTIGLRTSRYGRAVLNNDRVTSAARSESLNFM